MFKDNNFKKQINLERQLVRFLLRLNMNSIRAIESKFVRLVPCTAFRLSRIRFNTILIPIPKFTAFKIDSGVSNSIILGSEYPISFVNSIAWVRYVYVVSLLTISDTSIITKNYFFASNRSKKNNQIEKEAETSDDLKEYSSYRDRILVQHRPTTASA